jgi:molybdate transport system permease protein
VAVGRSLGLGPLAVFFRVTLLCAWRGVLAAIVLGFAGRSASSAPP